MSTVMTWLLLLAGIASFLAYDQNLARQHFKILGGSKDDFFRWWITNNLFKLSVAGGVLLIVTLALFLQGHNLAFPDILGRMVHTKRVRWGLIALLMAAALVALDLLMAWRFYQDDCRGDGTVGVRFYRWWLGMNARKFAIAGMLAGLSLGGAYAAHLGNIWPFVGENSGYLASAQRYYGEKKFREATLELKNAIRQDHGDHEAHLWLARSCRQLGNLTEALSAYREAVRVEPKLYAAHLELGSLAYAMKKPVAAEAAARQALSLAPAAPEPRLLLARIYGVAGRRELALAQCRAIPERQLTSPELRKELITLLFRNGAWGEALQMVEAGMKGAPHDIPLTYLQVQALLGLGRGAEAEAVLRRLAGVTDSPDPCFILGELLIRRGEYPAALKEYEEALRRAPNSEVAISNIASLIAEHGSDLERSASLAARLYARQPRNCAVADTLGWTLYRQDKLAQALPLLRQAVAGMPGNPEHRYHLGAALMRAGERSSGRRELERALKITGDFDGAAQARELLQQRG